MTNCEKRCVGPEFITENKIMTDTQPNEYTDLIFPFQKKVVKQNEHIIFQFLTRWTNLKAILSGAGVNENFYKYYKPFTAKDLRPHFGVYF